MKKSIITIILLATLVLAPSQKLYATKDPGCVQGCENTLNMNLGLCNLALAAGIAACAIVCVETLGLGCASCIAGINIGYAGCCASAAVGYNDCYNGCPDVPPPTPTPAPE